jgi:hypothetical protein
MSSPSLYIINIHPRNWDRCHEQSVFGLRTQKRHPDLRTGDICLVRMIRPGPGYGVRAIWKLKQEKPVDENTTVPWTDSKYSWILYFEPLVEFQAPFNEEFEGTSKYSKKVELYAASFIGAIVPLEGPSAKTYVTALMNEKLREMEGIDYDGSPLQQVILQAARDSANPLLRALDTTSERPMPHQPSPVAHDLEYLLKSIHNGAVVLPEFQRDFVWAPKDTVELLLSLSRNYPAGSLLFLRYGPSGLGTRPFEGVDQGKLVNPVYIVLDGQQRLTALYHALYGRGEYRYAISLKDLKETNSLRDSLIYPKAEKFQKKYSDKSAQFGDLIFPLSTLFGEEETFSHPFEWINEMAEYIEPSDEDRRKRTKIWLSNTLWKGIVEPIHRYKFPVVELPGDVDLGDICDIFEVLNKTGIKLTVFELLTARFWPAGVRLRDLWDAALDNIPLIQEFAIEPVLILQAVALVGVGACKTRDLLQMQAPQFQRHWEDVLRATKEALGILKGDCGVLSQGLLPYTSLLPSMVATITSFLTSTGSLSGIQREKLQRWFWCSVFGQTYEQATDTQNAKDFAELTDWLADGEEASSVSEFRFDKETLFRTTSPGSSIYKGILCLILRNGARDLSSGERISTELLKNEKIEDHHIFPKGYLKTHSPKVNPDTILNKTLISAITNRRIHSRPPHDYLEEIRGSHSKEKFGEVLESHFLPPESESEKWASYDSFVAWRSEALHLEMMKAAGKLVETPTSPTIVVEERIIRPGQRNLAEKVFADWVQRYYKQGEVIGFLMYIDSSTFAFLDHIPRPCSIRLLVGALASGEESQCLAAANKAAKGRESFEISRMKYEERPFAHERWLSNGEYEIELGTDLKESTMGKNEHTMRLLKVGKDSLRFTEFSSIYKEPSSYGQARREVFFGTHVQSTSSD